MTTQMERPVTDEVPRLSSKNAIPEDQMVPVFELDGRTYYIPEKPPASAMLAMLRVSLEQGDSYGQIELLRRLLGEENYAALESCPTLEFEDFNTILAIVGKHSIGMWESFRAAAGNSFGGPQT